MTHYQQAQPGSARFVAVQPCAGDNKIRRAAFVTIGGSDDESVRYRGQTEHGGRVSFKVVDGNEVQELPLHEPLRHRPRARQPGAGRDADRRRLVLAPRRAVRRSSAASATNGVVKGTAREQISGCDSEKMTWRAERRRQLNGPHD